MICVKSEQCAEADQLAGQAAQRGRDQKYEHPDKGLDKWSIQQAVTREAARLTFAVDCLFPRNDRKDQNGATQGSSACEVAAAAAAVKPSATAELT